MSEGEVDLKGFCLPPKLSEPSRASKPRQTHLGVVVRKGGRKSGRTRGCLLSQAEVGSPACASVGLNASTGRDFREASLLPFL